MKRFLARFLVLVLSCAIGCSLVSPVHADDAKNQKAQKISYAKQIMPILAANCFTCHGPDAAERKARLRLDTFKDATAKRRTGDFVVAPGKPAESTLVTRIYATDPYEIMPPPETQHKLTAKEKDLLKEWIAQGAEYESHWAFAKPQRPALPQPKQKNWARNPIDLFILAKMEAAGMQPSPEADRYTLARRVALDLTGLPPTIAQVDAFVNDPAPNAYEKYVDEILKSPAYGERWAAVWLDLARYADSNGYAEDNPRVIWKYRDWVIKAINKNTPFDQFTIEQLAGDMLPNPTEDQLIATAFHRNTPSNDEGGTDDEEFRVAAVVDRVNTTMQTWMGLTMACAQCHNHKYDPLSQEEYFQIYAIFNQTEDSDKRDLRPTLVQYTPEQLKRREDLQKRISDMQKEINGTKDANQKKAKQKQLAELQKQFNGVRGISTPIQRELAKDKQRKTHIQVRGNFLNKGKEVAPNVPELFHDIPTGTPVNRLTLARWLVSPENPLTSRVTVNRYWERIFGKGLVETSEDFGIRGDRPTHPDLLDWLAVEFIDQNWDVKQLLRTIVTSATYRQSSRVTADMIEVDPENKFYARAPRFRNNAEMIRDQALSASGLLSDKMFGPPVNPPRPNFGLRAAFGGNTDWTTSKGEDKFRRAVYTQWRRSTPYPSMVTFDAPERNVCTVKRPRTNTPLQALVTLNDPVYVEAAQALARRVIREGGKTVEDKARHGFRLCVTRPPSDRELQTLVRLYDNARARYAKDPQSAQQMATEPLGPVPAGMDTIDLAAWTVVGNVLLNLDEMLMKR